MGCIALVRCVLVLRCGLAVVVWYPYAGWSPASIKRDQLDVTCFIISLFKLNMFRMLIHPSSGACDLFVELFHGLYWSGSKCVGVTLWFGWGGVVSVCRLKHFDVCWCYFVVLLWWCGIRMQAEALVPEPANGFQQDAINSVYYISLVLTAPYFTQCS